MIVYEPSHRCGICVRIGTDPSIKGKIEGTRVFRKDGVSVNSVVRELGITTPSFYHHIKKHHYVTGRALKSKEEAKAYRQEAAQVQQVAQVIQRIDDGRDNYEDVWDTILNQGRDLINSGQMRVTSMMVMKAAADKASFVAKKQDRKLETAKAMFAFTTGKAGISGGQGTGETATNTD